MRDSVQRLPTPDRSPAATQYLRPCASSAERRSATGLPLEILDRDDQTGVTRSAIGKTVSLVDRAARATWPSLFAYQYVAVLSRDPARIGGRTLESRLGSVA